MISRKQVISTLLIAVLAGLIGLYVFAQLEHYEEVVDQGPYPQVISNPYLAAEHFLRQRSIPVSETDALVSLPDPQQPQTLMLLSDRRGMSPWQADALLDWAHNGGHLIIVAEPPRNSGDGQGSDRLLDTLGIRRYLSKDIKELDRQQATARAALPIPLAPPVPPPPETPWPELTRLYLENEQAPAYMSFNPAYHLEDPKDEADSWANSAEATHLLQLHRGEGLITVLSDAELWKTRAIARYDNAWLLWYLTQGTTVTLVRQAKHDALPQQVARHFPAALSALAVLLLLTMWHFAMREGPVRGPASRNRRSLAEHAHASASFLSRRNGQQALLKNLQLDVLRRARLRHPGFDRLAVAEQWKLLARTSRQSTGFISDALRPRPAQRLSNADFTRQVAHLQTLRNAL